MASSARHRPSRSIASSGRPARKSARAALRASSGRRERAAASTGPRAVRAAAPEGAGAREPAAGREGGGGGPAGAARPTRGHLFRKNGGLRWGSKVARAFSTSCLLTGIFAIWRRQSVFSAGRDLPYAASYVLPP